jgi:mono/diheme cytochrome c family protein
MNTTKQITIILALLFGILGTCFGYTVTESAREEKEAEHLTERNAERGARIYVNNCRSCHGHQGLGSEEGAVGAKINSPAFLILEEENKYGAEPTSKFGSVDSPGYIDIRNFVRNTLRCGRAGTYMPAWSEEYGGTLSDTQIDQLVTMITTGRWDLVVHEIIEHDIENNTNPDEVILRDPSGMAITSENCGQYNAVQALKYRTRQDPRLNLIGGEKEESVSDESTKSSAPTGPMVKGLPVDQFYAAACAVCHGVDRKGIESVGSLPLLPSYLTKDDDFYFETLVNGRAGTVMPSWRAQGLSDEEMWNLVEFIKYTQP